MKGCTHSRSERSHADHQEQRPTRISLRRVRRSHVEGDTALQRTPLSRKPRPRPRQADFYVQRLAETHRSAARACMPINGARPRSGHRTKESGYRGNSERLAGQWTQSGVGQHVAYDASSSRDSGISWPMARFLKPREQVKKMLAECIRAGEDVDAKAAIAEQNWRHRDWLDLFAKWRADTIKTLKNAYDGSDIALEFEAVTQTAERSTAQYTFDYRKPATRLGIRKLETLIAGLPLALSQSPDTTAIGSLHPEILSRCRGLFDGGDYAEAVEKSFKVVRDRLRSLTNYETPRRRSCSATRGRRFPEWREVPFDGD
jgi:hypothetical protein